MTPGKSGYQRVKTLEFHYGNNLKFTINHNNQYYLVTRHKTNYWTRVLKYNYN